MIAYYLTGRSEYLQASYAPTARAKCKACKDTIALNSLRIGEIMDDDHFSGQAWYHCECYTLKPRFKAINPETQIYELDNLDEEDMKCVLRQVFEGLKRFNGGKEVPQKYLASKREGKGKVQVTIPKQEIKEPKKGGKSKSKPKIAEKQEVQEIPKNTRATRATRATSRSAKTNEKPAQKSKSVPAKSAQSAKKTKLKKTPIEKQGLSAAQNAKLKKLEAFYFEKTIDELKIYLGYNSQSRSGTKGDLVKKCADGKLLGRIPTCGSCGGGKLRFNKTTGIYTCPGYMDDDVFKNCNKSFTSSEITRTIWIQ